MSRKRSAGIIVRKRQDCLVPVSGYDAERLAGFPDGAEFDLLDTAGRSVPQHRTYWKTLAQAVEAMGHAPWPTAEHLHDALKRDLGYVTVSYDLAGKPYVTTDSTAFDAMSQKAFAAYFEQAMARLAEVVGADPLDWLEAA